MSSTSPSSAASRAVTGFLEALAAGLPATHGWAFPSLVGVSGGADSVALLLGLVRLAPAEAVARLVVAHADHGLRADSAADCEFVRELAAGCGLGFVTRRLEVSGHGGGEGLEAQARRLRYAFLAEAAHACGARHVLVAHTADDQAETVLHRILRGTGLAGLAGMRRSRRLADGVALLRPLLHVPRAQARGFLEAVGQGWREDATNHDSTRARNFLRHEVLPRCTAGPYPAAAESLVRLAGQAAASADALASAAEHLLAAHGRRDGDGTVVLEIRGLRTLHPHLRAEVFVALWRREGWPCRDMTAAHYRRLGELAEDESPTTAAAIDFPGGVRVGVGPTHLVLRAPGLQRPMSTRL
ncbi:MAG: tRNA lysidine(34) synthetase TilS [Planctomycetota bacterium]